MGTGEGEAGNINLTANEIHLNSENNIIESNTTENKI